MKSQPMLPPKVAFEGAIALFKKELPYVPAQALSGMFTAFFARVADEITDEFWAEAMEGAKSPCEKPNCICERSRTAIMQALELARNDWRKAMAEARGEKGFAA